MVMAVPNPIEHLLKKGVPTLFVLIISLPVFFLTPTLVDAAVPPIARWDVVPYQRIDQGASLNIGVVAFSRYGIEKVEFRISGPGTPRTKETRKMRLNPRTNVVEYWVTLSASEFSGDGVVTIEATVIGGDGGVRDKNTGGGGLGLDPLELNVNPNGTLFTAEAWVDATNGDNQTGAVNDRSHPFANIDAAATAIGTASGNNALDGCKIYLEEGDHLWAGREGYTNPSYHTSTGWLTVTKADGASKENTRIVRFYGQWVNDLTKIEGITLTNPTSPGGYGLLYRPNSNGKGLVWTDDNRHIGIGRDPMVTTPYMYFKNASVYMTSCYVRNTSFATPNSRLVRNTDVEELGNDAFVNVALIINCTARDLVGTKYGNHSDAMQWWGAQNDDNVIVYNFRATELHYQGIFIRGATNNSSVYPPNAQGMAFVNVYIGMAEDCEGGNGWYRRTDHLIWWNMTFVRRGLCIYDDPYTGLPDLTVTATDFSAKGNMFHDLKLNHNDSEIDYSDWDHNHFEVTTGHGVITRGTNQTTGDAQLDSTGIPLPGSPLIDRISPPMVPIDINGNLRDEYADIGAFEYGAVSPPVPREKGETPKFVNVLNPTHGEELQIPCESDVQIFNRLGKEIIRLTCGSSEIVPWRGQNTKGETVAAGVYTLVEEGKKSEKVVVIK